jgi:hypothetical protein
VADNRTAAVGAGAVVKVRRGGAPIEAVDVKGSSVANSRWSGQAGCTEVVTGRAIAACT